MSHAGQLARNRGQASTTAAVSSPAANSSIQTKI